MRDTDLQGHYLARALLWHLRNEASCLTHRRCPAATAAAGPPRAGGGKPPRTPTSRRSTATTSSSFSRSSSSFTPPPTRSGNADSARRFAPPPESFSPHDPDAHTLAALPRSAVNKSKPYRENGAHNGNQKEKPTIPQPHDPPEGPSPPGPKRPEPDGQPGTQTTPRPCGPHQQR